jgi:hypothetical protein
VLATLCWAPVARGFDLAELMAALARVEQSRVAFDERRYLPALTEPIARGGTLLYVRPDRLEMRVERPQLERMEIRGDEITLETRSGTRRASLASEPVLAAWIDGLRGTLAGDLATLDRHFRTTLAGARDAWKLELVPRERELAAFVKHIEITGKHTQMLRFEIDDARGNRSVLELTPMGSEAQ